MNQNDVKTNPRVIIIQKLYAYHLNKDTELHFPKHRYKKFIKDVVTGSIERKELIENLIESKLKEYINKNKTELIVRLMILAALYEFMFMHKTPVKVIIAEYLKVSDLFIESSQKNFLNAILDKASKISRVTDVTN